MTVPNKEICQRYRRSKSTVVRLLPAAKGLRPNVLPGRKNFAALPRITTNATDNILKRQVLKNPYITAVKLKTKDVNLF